MTLAANGFDALSRYDTNVDHMVSALDPVWADLRIWQDTKQDGISQPEELHTLAALGIETITVNAEASSLNLGNGNTMPWRGSGEVRDLRVRMRRGDGRRYRKKRFETCQGVCGRHFRFFGRYPSPSSSTPNAVSP